MVREANRKADGERSCRSRKVAVIVVFVVGLCTWGCDSPQSVEPQVASLPPAAVEPPADQDDAPVTPVPEPQLDEAAGRAQEPISAAAMTDAAASTTGQRVSAPRALAPSVAGLLLDLAPSGRPAITMVIGCLLVAAGVVLARRGRRRAAPSLSQ